MVDLAIPLGPVGAAPATPITKRQVTAAVIGNALEFYDFTVYATFAVQIGHAFFPSHTPFVSLILSLATFGAGFALRPVGAVVIGRLADRRGRRPAMLVSFTLMGVAILGLALTPSYAVIGPAAPILALAFRLCQGFALGGEVGPTTAFLVEAAPSDRRGLYGAWQSGSQNIASIAGGVVGVSLAHFAGAASLSAWGWRLALLLGALVLPFGLVLRRELPETLHRPEAPPPGRPDGATLRGHARILAVGVGLIAAATVSTYVFGFMTTYALTTLKMAPGISLAATVVNGAFGLAGGLLGGAISDRRGRKALMIWPRILCIALTWPAFALMVRHHNAPALLGATAVLVFLVALGGSAVLVAITESLSKPIRGLGMGALYAITVAVFGGTTQPIIATLIHVTGDPLAPAWYMMAFSGVGLVAALFLTESAPGAVAEPRARRA